MTECSCQDNWTLSNGNSTCGAPACAGGNTAATSVKKPVDVIIAIDNSSSMAGKIAAVQTRISTDLAQILADSGVDYRAIMVSRFGDVNTAVGDSEHRGRRRLRLDLPERVGLPRASRSAGATLKDLAGRP